ncbi:SDR family NAD(P)-dependent oxidoreductase [Qingshengfaniella alkalisoli]|uniref:SDR family oxidoreductase n=1 Tax=Qingshengfaniella alkalisoli TaxID=2599296 RepID=A0A5B8IBG4_9RHOB|nr:SDR family NAD(P)-dependent oxidoreductase [Qingshengfaniella alkalisoli]QDY71549.1 SDR family oxidoreductase [Qingshengfaniella alkalisoli]
MKNVIVTGVSRGLGLAIATSLAAREDYRVIGLSRTIGEGYQVLMDAHPDRVVHITFDAAEIDAIPGIVRGVTKEYGAIYGLVNNAAIGMDGVLATLHGSDIARALRVNLESPITLTKYVSRSMMAKREGRIINISSIIASTGFHALSAYAASKAGLEGFTRSLSRELGKMGITVNCVAPGYMETAMTEGIRDDHMASIRRRAPLGLPTPENAAGAVVYLLGEDAARTSGTVLTVDGGSTA